VRCDGIWKPTRSICGGCAENCDISSKLRIRGRLSGRFRSGAESPTFYPGIERVRGISGSHARLAICVRIAFRAGAFEAALDLYRARFSLPANWNGVRDGRRQCRRRDGRPKHGVCSPLSSRCPCTLFAAVRFALPQPVDDLKRMASAAETKP